MMMVYNFIVFLIFNLSSSASERIIEFDLGYKFNETILFETDDNNLYFTFNYINECELDFIKYNYKSKVVDTFSISIPEVGELNCANSDKQIDGYYISNDSLFVKYRYSIFIYKIDLNSSKLVKSVFLDQIIKRGGKDNRVGYKFKKYNNKIIGYLDVYIEHKLVNNNLFIWSYDLKTNQVDTISVKQPIGYKWTQMQPKNLVDVQANKLISCDLEKDNIYLIHNEDSISNIELNIFNNSWSVENQLPINHPQDFFNLNKGKMDSMYIIHSIDFLDGNNILVKYAIPKLIETDLYSIFNFCVVSKKNNKWIVKNKINPELIFGDNRIDDKSIYGYYYLVSHGKLISKHFSYHYNRNEKSFIRVEDISDILKRLNLTK